MIDGQGDTKFTMIRTIKMYLKPKRSVLRVLPHVHPRHCHDTSKISP